MFEGQWPPEQLPATEEYLVAVGTFSLFFNEAEMALWVFFRAYIDNADARNYLFEALHNRARVDLIKLFVEKSDDDAFRAHALAGLSAFELVCENRNVILHAFPFEYHDTESRLVKRRKNDPGNMAVFHAPLEDVRANAMAANHVHWFFFGLSHYLEKKQEQTAGYSPPELPPLPPRPRKLSLYQPRDDQADG